MRVLAIVLALVVAAQAVPVVEQDAEARNSLIVQALLRQAAEFLHDVLHNGHEGMEIPVMEPLRIDDARFELPGQLLTIDLELSGANMTGLGNYRMDRADFSLITLRFHYDIVIPLLSIRSARYKMNGDFVKAIPLYGEGEAYFDIEGLRMVGVAQMGRSDDGRSLNVKEITEAVFSLDAFVARTTGYIGGGDIDNVFNALLTDLVHDYVTRFSRHISMITTPIIRDVCNKYMEKLNTWEILFPRA